MMLTVDIGAAAGLESTMMSRIRYMRRVSALDE